MDEYEEAAAVIRANGERAHFVGPRDPSLVTAAEAAVGRPFPPVYRRFVSELGAGSFDSFEVYGVIDADFEDSSVPDGIWVTLSERADGMLPEHLLVVGDVGDGSLYCLDLDEGEEPPVVVFEPGADAPPVERVADDFGSFLLEGVETAAPQRA